MKLTKKNKEILKELGFFCDFTKTRNVADKEWYSLKNGWGFRLDAHKDFKSLFLTALKYEEE